MQSYILVKILYERFDSLADERLMQKESSLAGYISFTLCLYLLLSFVCKQ